MVNQIIILAQWFFLVYVIALNLSYLILNILSLISLNRYMQEEKHGMINRVFTGYELPVSILIPAYNEESTIEATILSIMQLDYPEYEIIVINDGSKDATLQHLKERFSLEVFPEAYRVRLPVQKIHTVYLSTIYPNLRVIDKSNGGKSDALNTGINISRYPLFCCIDADSILQRDSLHQVVKPFMEDPRTIAAGGTVRIANGCKVRKGYLEKVGLPRNILVLIQIVEYLRAFLFGRLGWVPINSLLVISGAFSLFHKESVIAAGGYRTNTIGEDMELIVRLHYHFRLQSKPYRITFVPDPVCWTEAPETLAILKSQRTRWQRGLGESLGKNWRLLFHRKGGGPGWLAFPFMLFFELFGPFFEVGGYIFFISSYFLYIISYDAMFSFLLLAFSFGLLISVTGLLLEELSFRIYKKPQQIMLLLLAIIIENLGFRQLIAFWRLSGLLQWLTRRKVGWGAMVRKANWQTK